jgi:hypothetical protein
MKRLLEYLAIYDVPVHAGANQALIPEKGKSDTLTKLKNRPFFY